MSGKTVGRCARSSMAPELKQKTTPTKGLEQTGACSSGGMRRIKEDRGRRHRRQHQGVDRIVGPPDGEGRHLSGRHGLRPPLWANWRGAGHPLWEGSGRSSQRALWFRHRRVRTASKASRRRRSHGRKDEAIGEEHGGDERKFGSHCRWRTSSSPSSETQAEEFTAPKDLRRHGPHHRPGRPSSRSSCSPPRRDVKDPEDETDEIGGCPHKKVL